MYIGLGEIMNVCRLMNKLYTAVDYAMCGSDGKALHECEYDLQGVFLCIIIFTMTSIFISWWTIPFRYIVHKTKINEIKFKCER